MDVRSRERNRRAVVVGVAGEEPAPHRTGLVVLPVLAAGVLLLVTLLVSAEGSGDTPPLRSVDAFLAALDDGSYTELEQTITDAPTTITWPSGPPWDGPLRRTIWFDGKSGPKFDGWSNTATLEDYQAYHRELNGSTEVSSCFTEAPIGLTGIASYDTWVVCRFVTTNDLTRLLGTPVETRTGTARFGIWRGKVRAVVAAPDSVADRTSWDFMLWMRSEHPDDFAAIIGDRFTVPRYDAATASALRRFAGQFAVATS